MDTNKKSFLAQAQDIVEKGGFAFLSRVGKPSLYPYQDDNGHLIPVNTLDSVHLQHSMRQHNEMDDLGISDFRDKLTAAALDAIQGNPQPIKKLAEEWAFARSRDYVLQDLLTELEDISETIGFLADVAKTEIEKRGERLPQLSTPHSVETAEDLLKYRIKKRLNLLEGAESQEFVLGLNMHI